MARQDLGLVFSFFFLSLGFFAMGAKLGHALHLGGDLDMPDPISGLSPRDILNLQHSWAPIYANAADNGLELFKRFFRAQPDAKALFKQVRNVDIDHLDKSHQFRAHCINFMSAINMVVLTLDEPNVVIAMLHKLGDAHKKHHVPKKHFDTLEKVLDDFLSNDLKLSPTVLNSWTILIKFMYPHMLGDQCGQEIELTTGICIILHPEFIHYKSNTQEWYLLGKLAIFRPKLCRVYGKFDDKSKPYKNKHMCNLLLKENNGKCLNLVI